MDAEQIQEEIMKCNHAVDAQIPMSWTRAHVRRTTHDSKIVRAFDREEDEDCCDHPPIAIIRRTPYGYYCVVKHEFVTFHSELMRPGDKVDGVVVGEGLRDVCAKQEPCTPRAQTPSTDICAESASAEGVGSKLGKGTHRLDLTTEGHTLVLHGVLLVCDQLRGSDVMMGKRWNR